MTAATAFPGGRDGGRDPEEAFRTIGTLIFAPEKTTTAGRDTP
ncbi:hypothetical protein [Streptomyces californicus]